jgi:hypothetical protein
LGLPVPLTGPPDEVVEVVVDPSASLHVRLLDGDVPIAETRVLFSLWESGIPQFTRQTDQGGRIVDDEISPASLIAIVDAAGYWPTAAPVEASHEAQERVIQVRRTGSLEIVVRQEGIAISGASVDLLSDEFGERASMWLAAGKVRSDGAGLTTDAQGSSRVFGLPNGSYTWTVAAPGVEAREGKVVVPPHGVERLVVDL